MPEMKVNKSIDIDASADQAWEWLADIGNWPKWKPFIIASNYCSGGALKVGSKLRFKPKVGPVPIYLYAKIVESNPPRRLVWEGSAPGVKAVHSFEFEDLGGNKTRVTTRETMSGIGIFALRLLVPQSEFEGMHDRWLQAFKDRAAKK
jgi:uncharacterized membrane protein